MDHLGEIDVLYGVQETFICESDSQTLCYILVDPI